MSGRTPSPTPEPAASDCAAATEAYQVLIATMQTLIPPPDYLTPLELCLGLACRLDGAAVPASLYRST